MRTNIVLDENLVSEAMRLSGSKTKREVVDLALRELIRSKKKLDLLELVGEIDLEPDFDHKKVRRTRYDPD